MENIFKKYLNKKSFARSKMDQVATFLLHELSHTPSEL